MKQKQNTKLESKINAILTRNQARKQNAKIYEEPKYKDFSDSNEEKDEESDDEPHKKKEKRKVIKNKTISVPISRRKRGRLRKDTLKILNKNKPKKKKQKRKK